MHKEHTDRVAGIVAQVRANADGKRIKIYHGSSNSTRVPDFTGRHVVDTSGLRHIIEVNATEQFVLVEPSVQMDQLVDATLEYGLVPPVVMEFPGISVGGGVQGGAAESASFIYGGFHETALEYEIVLGDGSVVQVSPDTNPDLFWGTACSYGSLGILTLVKLRLVPATPYVKLTYQRTTSNEHALQVLDQAVNRQGIDFIDGILYSPQLGTIMTGHYAVAADGPVSTFNNATDEWFYVHAKNIVTKHQEYTEYIPIRDYLFRYDRGAFWVGRHVFSYLKLPFSKYLRTKWDRVLRTRFLYRAVQKTNLSQQFFAQDIFMPRSQAPAFMEYIIPTANIWPLWLLPMRPHTEQLDLFGLSFPAADYVLNFGVWGHPKTKSFQQFKQLNRDIETQLLRLGARKTLYAHSYYPKNEFWQIYNRPQYETLRAKYHADGIFEDVYDKVTVTQEYKGSIWAAIGKHFVKKLHRK